MICSYCHNEITSDPITESGYSFCNPLCRHQFLRNSNGTPPPAIIDDKAAERSVFFEDLDFHLNIEGFEGRDFLLRCNYFTGTHLHLDGKKLRPYKRQLFRRKRFFKVIDNRGNETELTIKRRGGDVIPRFWVNQKEIVLAQKLRWYEYLWIAFPLFFIALFGGIAGLVLGVAAFMNAIIFRKIKKVPLKYLMTGANTVVAFIFAWNVLSLIAPYMQKMTMAISQDMSVSEQIRGSSYEELTKHVWHFDYYLDTAGNKIDGPQSNLTNSDLTFNGNGSLWMVPENYPPITGQWTVDPSNGKVNIRLGAEKLETKIIGVTEDELHLQLFNYVIVFKTV